MKKIISLILITCSLLICFSATVFAETSNNEYSVLKTLEIMVGDEDGNMRLDDKVTRAEFTKVATTISSFRKAIPLSQKTSPFSDVPYKHWASAYIKAGVDNGIITGFPDSTFKPDNYVKYEEALTILLKILGYTDTDFGSSYPYGQFAIANNIDLTENIDANLFEDLTRKQVADLLINALETNFKNTMNTPYSNFDAVKVEDIVILASSKEDSAITSDKVATTNGVYKYSKGIENYVGYKGDAIIKDGDTIIHFEPSNKTDNLNKYVIYSSVSDGVIVYKNKEFSQIELEDNTPTYYNNNLTTFSSIKNAITMGDTIHISKNINNEIDYVNIYKGNLSGPYVYSTLSSLTSQLNDINDYLIIKDGNTITVDELSKYDVYYYSKELKIVMVYNTKITGVYNSATPNQESPISVDISGKTYQIESGDAFKDLSSTGKFKYGDTITILLGKDKKIAGVVSTESVKSKLVGYVLDAGVKNYTTNNDKLSTQYFISVVMPDGELVEYKSKRDHSNYKNSVSEIKFDGELATLNRINTDSDKISGKFVYDNLSLGKYTVSKNVQIIDIATEDNNKVGSYVKISPQRIDGVSLSSSSILYYETNEKNMITKLILKNVTNDYYQYGIVQKVEKNEQVLAASYVFNINGTEMTMMTQNQIFGVNVGPAYFRIENNQVTGMQNITAIKGKISEITSTFLKAGSTSYLFSDNLKVFYRNYNWDYMLVDIEDVIKEDSEYKIQGAYIDKQPTSGGRVRVILVTK